MAVGPDNFERRVNKAPPETLEPVGSGKSGALLGTWADGTKAIVKVAKNALPNGKTSQRGIPVETHPRRELAYVKLAEMLGWSSLVPKVALFQCGGKEASAQAFLTAAHLNQFCKALNKRTNDGWVEGLRETTGLAPKSQWLRLVVMDLLANSRDRHINNVGLRILFPTDKATYRLVAWDNAVSFGESFHFYHQVFHKYLFRKHLDLSTVWDTLTALREQDFNEVLGSLITPEEVRHAWRRCQFLVEFPYRLPWKRFSKGNEEPGTFPDYKEYFVDASLQNPVLSPDLGYATVVATP